MTTLELDYLNSETLQKRVISLKKVLTKISESFSNVTEVLKDTNCMVHNYNLYNLIDAKKECNLYIRQILSQLEILKKWTLAGEKQQFMQFSVLPSHKASMLSQIELFKKRLLNTQVFAFSYLNHSLESRLRGLTGFLSNEQEKNKSLEGLHLDENVAFKSIITRIKVMLAACLPQANIYDVVENGELKITISLFFLVDLVFDSNGEIQQVQINDELDLPMPQICLWALQSLKSKNFDNFFDLLKLIYNGRFALARKTALIVGAENVLDGELSLTLDSATTKESLILSILLSIEDELVRIAVHEIDLRFPLTERLYLRTGLVAPSPAGPVSIFYIHPLYLLDIQLKELNKNQIRSDCNSCSDIEPPTCNSNCYKSEKFSLDFASVFLIEQLKQRGFYDWLKPESASQLKQKYSLELYEVYSARIIVGVAQECSSNSLPSFFIENFVSNSNDQFNDTEKNLLFELDLLKAKHLPDSTVTWKKHQCQSECYLRSNLTFILVLSDLVPICYYNLKLIQSISSMNPVDLENLKSLESRIFKQFCSSTSNNKNASFWDILQHSCRGQLTNASFGVNGIKFKFLTSKNTNLKHFLIKNIPFTHLAQFQPILWVLRKQIVWNNLHQSCFCFSNTDQSKKRSHTQTENTGLKSNQSDSNADDQTSFTVEVSELNNPYFGFQVIFNASKNNLLVNFLINVQLNGFVCVSSYTSNKNLSSYQELEKLLNKTHNLPLSLSAWFKNSLVNEVGNK